MGRPPLHRRYGVSLIRRHGVRWDHRATAARQILFIRPLLRSDLICIRLKIFSHPPKQLRRCKVKPHGSLVPVSSTHRCAYTPGLSTSSSSTFLQDSQGVRENHLGASFVLRCFQHLSLPHLATGQCHWHDNPNTSDASTPVLSY